MFSNCVFVNNVMCADARILYTNGFLLQNKNKISSQFVSFTVLLLFDTFFFFHCDFSGFILNGFNHIHSSAFVLHGFYYILLGSSYDREKRKCKYKWVLFMPIYDTNETKSKEQKHMEDNNKHSANKH